MSNFIQVQTDVVAVKVPKELRTTIHGLTFAIRKMPHAEYVKYDSFNLIGAADNDVGDRYFLIQVHPKGGQQ